MALHDTINSLRELLNNIVQDLEKAANGNKAASQRVRTGTVRLEKIAKAYRKESINSEKEPKSSKRGGTAKKASSAPASKKPAAKPTVKTSKVKAKGKAKSVSRPQSLSVKRPTAKLPVKR